MIYTADQAISQLPDLVARARSGEEIIITDGAGGLVKLSPIWPAGRRTPGVFAGKIALSDAFFDPLPKDELAAWGET